jgi:hypothetical protein
MYRRITVSIEKLQEIRRSRRMREARNVIIKRLKADHKYICHKPKNGMEEPDYETPAKTTLKDKMQALKILAHRSNFTENKAHDGEFMCGKCHLAAHVSYIYGMQIICGVRVPVCIDCHEYEQQEWEDRLAHSDSA